MLGGTTSGIAVVPTTDGSDVPALKAVAALAPDLIVGRPDGFAEVYPQLSAIAPTVGIEIDFSDAIGDPGAVTVLLGVGGGQVLAYRPGSVTARRVRCRRATRQSAVGNFGFQGCGSALDALTGQWPGWARPLRRARCRGVRRMLNIWCIRTYGPCRVRRITSAALPARRPL